MFPWAATSHLRNRYAGLTQTPLKLFFLQGPSNALLSIESNDCACACADDATPHQLPYGSTHRHENWYMYTYFLEEDDSTIYWFVTLHQVALKQINFHTVQTIHHANWYMYTSF